MSTLDLHPAPLIFSPEDKIGSINSTSHIFCPHPFFLPVSSSPTLPTIPSGCDSISFDQLSCSAILREDNDRLNWILETCENEIEPEIDCF